MRRFSILLFLLIPLAGFGQNCADLIPKLMETSGQNRSLNSTTATFKDRITDREDSGSMLVEDKEKLLKVLDRSFESKRVNSSVQKGLLAKCDAPSAAEALHLLQTPLAQKMLQMEADAESPENDEKMDRFVRARALQTHHSDRVKLIDNLLEANGYADLLSHAVIDISVEMMSGSIITRPPSGEVEQLKAKMRAETIHNVESAMLFIYKGATDDELQQYTAILHRPALKSFYRQSNELYLSAIRSEAAAVAAEIKKIETESQDIRPRRNY